MNRVLKLIRIEDVVHKTTLAKSTIWLKIAQGDFIRPTRIGGISVWKESGRIIKPSVYLTLVIKIIAGIQGIGQSHKLGPEVSNTSSASSFCVNKVWTIHPTISLARSL